MQQTITALENLYDTFKDDLSQIDAFIETTIREGASTALLPMLDHIIKGKGKRIRPILLLTCYKIVGNQPIDQNTVKIASALELIHIASLVHDDIIDEALIRRNQASFMAKWGNSGAVCMGVYLYSISLKLMSEVGSIPCLAHSSKAVNRMCHGELVQLASKKDTNLSEVSYYDIITCKTADLFKAAALCGAELAGASEQDLNNLGQCGHYLGLLFQLTDDYLDYFDDETHLKKKTMQDYDQRQITLPLHLLLKLDPNLKKDTLFDNKDVIIEKLASFNIKDACKEHILTYDEKFHAILSQLAHLHSPSISILKTIKAVVLSRLDV